VALVTNTNACTGTDEQTRITKRENIENNRTAEHTQKTGGIRQRTDRAWFRCLYDIWPGNESGQGYSLMPGGHTEHQTAIVTVLQPRQLQLDLYPELTNRLRRSHQTMHAAAGREQRESHVLCCYVHTGGLTCRNGRR